jgi:hypothetical protein
MQMEMADLLLELAALGCYLLGMFFGVILYSHWTIIWRGSLAGLALMFFGAIINQLLVVFLGATFSSLFLGWMLVVVFDEIRGLIQKIRFWLAS